MNTPRRSRPKDESYLPSPEEIRRRALAVRGDGDPADLPPPTDDDWRDWEQESEELPAIEPAERAEAREIAAADRSRRQAALLLDLARSISQRAASVNAGSPVAAGKDVPHFLAWSARLACKRLMLRGRSDEQIVDHFALRSSRRLLLPWLARVREQLYFDCRRYFAGGWTIERVFRNYFLGPAEPDRDVRPEECDEILGRLRKEVQVRAKVTKMQGKKPYRVTDERGRVLKTRHGDPLDRGGYEHQQPAAEQAAAINQTVAASQRERKVRGAKE